MAILNLSELIEHCTKHGYQLPMINIQSLPVLKGVVAWTKKHDIPFLASIDGIQVENGLIPSIEQILQSEAVSASIVARRITNEKQAIEAIRRGCQALFLAHDSDAIEQTAQACGIITQTEDAIASNFQEIEQLIEFNTLVKQEIASWHELELIVTMTTIEALDSFTEQSSAKGMAQDVKAKCKLYAPVEHLIIYNSSVDEAQTRQAAQIGATILDNIPGVRATWRGEAVKADAQYQWCWLIRFANEAVIDSYRDHPQHVAYANEQFRPIAGNRVSIDYTLFAPEND